MPRAPSHSPEGPRPLWLRGVGLPRPRPDSARAWEAPSQAAVSCLSGTHAPLGPAPTREVAAALKSGVRTPRAPAGDHRVHHLASVTASAWRRLSQEGEMGAQPRGGDWPSPAPPRPGPPRPAPPRRPGTNWNRRRGGAARPTPAPTSPLLAAQGGEESPGLARWKLRCSREESRKVAHGHWDPPDQDQRHQPRRADESAKCPAHARCGASGCRGVGKGGPRDVRGLPGNSPCTGTFENQRPGRKSPRGSPPLRFLSGRRQRRPR